jgi:hypothetical protein
VVGADGDEVVNVARDVVTRVLRVTLIDDPDDVAGFAQRVALKEAPKGDAAEGDGGSTATKDDGSTASASATSSRSRKEQRAMKRVPKFISNQACVAASWKGGAKADTWKFETAEHKMNEILVRCDGVSTSESKACSRVYVCFELCMVVHCRKGLGSSKPSSLKKDDPVMEVSCGWGVIPLFEQEPPPGVTAAEFGRSLEGCKDGKAIDIPLIAGSPLAPIRIKAASGMQAQKSLWRRAAARVGGSKAVLSIVVNKLGAKKPYTAHAAELPHTLVAPVMALSHITRLRGINKGVRSSAHFDALPFAEPAALIFPDILSDPFVLMTYLACWEEWVKKAVKVQKSRMKQGASSAEKRELAEHTRLMKGRFQTLAEDTLMPKTQLEGFRECALRMWPALSYENITARTWGANKASLSTRDAMAGYVTRASAAYSPPRPTLTCTHASLPTLALINRRISSSPSALISTALAQWWRRSETSAEAPRLVLASRNRRLLRQGERGWARRTVSHRRAHVRVSCATLATPTPTPTSSTRVASRAFDRCHELPSSHTPYLHRSMARPRCRYNPGEYS